MTTSNDCCLILINVITEIDGVLSKLHTLQLVAVDKYEHVYAQAWQDIQAAQVALVRRDLITTDQGGDEV